MRRKCRKQISAEIEGLKEIAMIDETRRSVSESKKVDGGGELYQRQSSNQKHLFQNQITNFYNTKISLFLLHQKSSENHPKRINLQSCFDKTLHVYKFIFAKNILDTFFSKFRIEAEKIGFRVCSDTDGRFDTSFAVRNKISFRFANDT